MTWIKQNKPIVITVVICVLLIFCSFCFALSAIVSKPAPIITETSVAIIQPTNTSLPTQTIKPTNTPQVIPTIQTEDIEAYRAKALDWSQRFHADNDVIVRVFQHEDVSDNELHTTGQDLARIQLEAAATTPPEIYKTFHKHFTSAITNYNAAIMAFGKGNITQANKLLQKALDEYQLANASIGA